jgi:hypothetical protein
MNDPALTATPARRPRGRPRTSGSSHCDRCGRLAGKLRTRWPEGGICGTCFHHAVRTVGACGRCGAHGMLPGLDGERRLCRRCAGITTDLDCHRCGCQAEHYRRGLCARCALRDDLTALLAPAAPPTPPISQLITVLCGVSRPESIHTWKRHPSVRALLSGLGNGTLALDHEAFDQASGGQAVEHLRDLLVHHDLLPHRDRDLARFENWLNARLSDTPATWARQLLEQYATWHHIRQIRSRIGRGQDIGGRVHLAKQEITEIGRLLAWLDDRDTTLAHCTQSQLDTWLSAGPSTRSVVRSFLRWACRHRLAPNLNMARRIPQNTPTITHQTRLLWLARCLRDEPDTRAYRVAATLLLLYAQPLVRIAALRCDQILSTPTGPKILLGNEPAAVVSPFAELLLDHLTHRPNMQTGNTNNPWLFPSTHAGRHLHPNTIMNRLRGLGIDLRGARNTALKQLVQQVPPPIVASQLGYHPAITQRHAEQAAQPDAHYAALIAR